MKIFKFKIIMLLYIVKTLFSSFLIYYLSIKQDILSYILSKNRKINCFKIINLLKISKKRLLNI